MIYVQKHVFAGVGLLCYTYEYVYPAQPFATAGEELLYRPQQSYEYEV